MRDRNDGGELEKSVCVVGVVQSLYFGMEDQLHQCCHRSIRWLVVAHFSTFVLFCF